MRENTSRYRNLPLNCLKTSLTHTFQNVVWLVSVLFNDRTHLLTTFLEDFTRVAVLNITLHHKSFMLHCWKGLSVDSREREHLPSWLLWEIDTPCCCSTRCPPFSPHLSNSSCGNVETISVGICWGNKWGVKTGRDYGGVPFTVPKLFTNKGTE